MKATLSLIFLSSFLAFSAHAELPANVASTNLSGTITTTNTFQSIQSQTNSRKGCSIQNNGSSGNPMYVYFGALGSATEAQSAVLQKGQSVNCTLTGGVNITLVDQVSITGTSGDVFFANFQ